MELMKDGGMEIIDCNNHVKTATNYFGPSCAVNCLSDKYNPIGDNSDKLCQLCIGKIPGGRCTDSDPYAGYEGAFRCLLEAGDIAFVKHNTVPELITGMEYAALSPDHFELLCKDGSRRPMNEYLSCNWGKVPSDAVVVSSAVPFEKREKFQMFLQKFAEKYPKRSNVTVYSTHNTDIYGTKRPEYDQYGNRIQSQYNQFGSRNRYRRQNFGDFGNSGPNRSRYNENRNSQGNYYNEDYNSYNTDTQYGNYPYVSDNNPRDRDRFNQNDYNRDQTTESHDNPFARDPYSLNPVQYGVNIDPYETDTKNIQPSRAFEDNDINNNAYNHTNTTFYEVFSLFESSLYGIHGNLLFQIPEEIDSYYSIKIIVKAIFYTFRAVLNIILKWV
ncbi:hypothetical protein NQ318_003256 [Aromia moschata]|uniref:Transferrin-like domain-containing protein n=1 Tax=Aromia moschata TaxID=1265417 RepID=A0AAV8XPW2_9CUCU|nr:hypothetical protein NQ318_003256 [Aromia moschata]